MMVTQLPCQVAYAVTEFSSMCFLFIPHLDGILFYFFTMNSYSPQKAGICILPEDSELILQC